MQPRVQMKRRGSLGDEGCISTWNTGAGLFSPFSEECLFPPQSDLDYLYETTAAGLSPAQWHRGRIYNSGFHVRTHAGTEMTFKFYSLMGKAARHSVNAAASSWWRSAAAWSVNTCLTCLLHINHICLLGNRKPRLHHAWAPHHFQRGVKLSRSPNLLLGPGQGHVEQTSWSRNQAHKWWRTPSFCLHIIRVANRRHSCCSTTRNHMGQCGAV